MMWKYERIGSESFHSAGLIVEVTNTISAPYFQDHNNRNTPNCQVIYQLLLLISIRY